MCDFAHKSFRKVFILLSPKLLMMPCDWSLYLSFLTLTGSLEYWVGSDQVQLPGFHPTSLRAPGGLCLRLAWHLPELLWAQPLDLCAEWLLVAHLSLCSLLQLWPRGGALSEVTCLVLHLPIARSWTCYKDWESEHLYSARIQGGSHEI